ADVHHFARDHRANPRVLYRVVGKSFGSMPRSRNDRSSGRRWLDTAPAARAAAPKTLIEFIIRRPKLCLFMSNLLAHEDRRLHVLEEVAGDRAGMHHTGKGRELDSRPLRSAGRLGILVNDVP